MGAKAILLPLAGAALVIGLAAASRPSVLSQIKPGLWEVARAGQPPRQVCISEAALLSQVEHQSAKCGQTILRNDASLAVVEYNCPGKGFGHSRISVLTPRSVKIETQGIADYAPFGYAVQAKRIRDC